MRIAIIGSGVSGLASAWLLSRQHEVTLFEANDYLGGHTHTHDIELQGKRYAVDTGFIVHNPANYPLFNRMLDELGVPSQPTTMGFSVVNEKSGLEYSATSMDTLFCQRRNIVSPRFWGMVRDIFRFYREAPALLDLPDAGPTLGDYLAEKGYGRAFRDDHLVPMASALWSSPSEKIFAFPARYLVQFMANHHMLQAASRPEWRVVRGGSSSYIHAMRKGWSVQERLGCPVSAVRRRQDCVEVITHQGVERFDQVVLACHGDQAFSMLADPSESEYEVLGAMRYQFNDTVLHTDAALMPKRRKAWAAWNALVPDAATDMCTVSYCMNLLQKLDAPEPLIVTLNGTASIDPAKILKRMRYHHPIYSHESVAAQARKAEIQGQRRTWFAGAYWGWGFHEDGMRSAVEVARALGVAWEVKAGQQASQQAASSTAWRTDRPATASHLSGKTGDRGDIVGPGSSDDAHDGEMAA